MCEIPDVYFSSGEFAALCGTTKATLFHYDEIGILRPAHKSEGGYRYYTDKQLFDYDLISSLTQIGTPLAEIRALKEDWAPQKYLDLLDRKEREIEEKEQQLKRTRSFLARIRSRTLHLMSITGQEMEFEQCPAIRYRIVPADENPIQDAQKEVLKRRHSNPRGSFSRGSITLREDIEAQNIRPAWYCFVGGEDPQPDAKTFDRPEGTYAVFYHVGEYAAIGDTIRAALARIEAMGFRLCGNVYESDTPSLFGSMQPGHNVFRLEAQVERVEPDTLID